MARPAASDLRYLQRLQAYYAAHRVFPAYVAIGRIVGLRSTSSVFALLRRLQSEGYILIRDRRVIPSPRFFERSVVADRIPAGIPMPVVEAGIEPQTIDAYLVRHPIRTFIVEVTGDSMTGAGLLPGDRLVVESRPTANPGDIVVASIDGEFTVKRLAREAARLVLRPENPSHPVLRPDPLQIAGVVVGSYRRYD